ncbi:rhomboid family intramembrane serine protease [Thermaerobacillus caldiproteolyticus]|uniref:Rhomboid protease GluP n=1 Tax=Thermaerobacillus caldiproteolyticus TaxID=247480 RepID=A0A7W0BYI5_9BACL|nr:rhomboid family intramembrane serine protease [Anoxybacillus caldiproteolyticus]MBA2873476.1 rhomboid protease GluP [Anoxybacillus caldiproteolyticus]
MNGHMELLYWQLVYSFVRRQYRIIKVSNGPNEIWLESFHHQNIPLIRIVRYDIDWSSWLKRDIEYAWRVAEQVKRRYMKRTVQVLNIYISTYPPVDDWEFLVEKPLPFSRDARAALRTVFIHSANVPHSLQQISEQIREPITLPSLERDEDPFLAAEHIKRQALQLTSEQQEREKRLFEYGRPIFTYAFIALQVFMFLLLEWKGGSTNPAVLIEYGAKFNPLIQEGEWWRFFTPIFLHIGFLHLFMNTFALYYLGTMVERLYGSWRFFVIYLTAGFFGTLGSFLFTSSLSAGASGAIFGLFGALLYFGTVYRHLFLQTIGMNVISLIVINLIFGLVIPGIDNAGHIGGLIGGFLAAGVVHLPRHRAWNKQVVSLFFTSCIVAAALYVGFR